MFGDLVETRISGDGKVSATNRPSPEACVTVTRSVITDAVTLILYY
jgi:hypothetical protein